MADMAERRRNRGPRKISDEQAEEIRRRYATGERAKDLANEFGMSQQQTNRIVAGQTRRLDAVPTKWREQGFTDPRQKLTDEQRDEIRRRFAAGESNASLSREFQVSNGYITEIVRGRKTRNRRSKRTPRRVRTLSPEEIAEVRLRWQRGGVSQRALADEFGIDPSTVSRMVTGMSHRDVS
jgi:Mor family transcriptional regulator